MAPADPTHLQAVKARLADIEGIDQLSVSMIGGRMVFGIKGIVIGLDPFAGDDQIETEIRKALGATAAPAAPAPVPIPTPMPAPAAASPATSKATTMSITGAAPATLSIKQMIEQSRQTVKAAHEKLATNAAKVAQAAAALDSLGDDLGKEGDDLLAMVGQYKNDLSGS